MNKSDATTIVLLTAILIKHNEALKKVGDDKKLIAQVNEHTIEAIRDNAHNINPMLTSLAVPKEKSGE